MREDRWQTGDCGIYATALIERCPWLRLGAVVDDSRGERSWLHFFAHDDTTAFDSRGSHPLPYRQTWDSAFRDYFTDEAATEMGLECVTDLDVRDFGLSPGERAEMQLAWAHMKRHGILDAVMYNDDNGRENEDADTNPARAEAPGRG